MLGEGYHSSSRPLSLTAYDLREIADALERTQQANIRFDGELRIGHHRITIEWQSDQRDGDWAVVVAIRSVT